MGQSHGGSRVGWRGWVVAPADVAHPDLRLCQEMMRRDGGGTKSCPHRGAMPEAVPKGTHMLQTTWHYLSLSPAPSPSPGPGVQQGWAQP